ncbi:MAG TPA: STAS domain-containing protein [Solirubrobacteraceae bacterium]|jgi:anti-anti-sigma factor|nr:STAS domain-containing protein [Solirubrobacteraceae bacterium]
MGDSLELTHQIEPGAVALNVVGEVDADSCGALGHALHRAEAADSEVLILDLTDVSFIDSTGLKTIIEAVGRLNACGRHLTTVCPPGPVRRLLELTAVTGYFDLCATRAEASPAARAG